MGGAAMSLELTEEESAEVESVLELLDSLKDSMEKYYDWAELLHTEFREMKARVLALEARMDLMGSVGHDVSCCDDSDDDGSAGEEGDLVGRLERLKR